MLSLRFSMRSLVFHVTIQYWFSMRSLTTKRFFLLPQHMLWTRLDKSAWSRCLQCRKATAFLTAKPAARPTTSPGLAAEPQTLTAWSSNTLHFCQSKLRQDSSARCKLRARSARPYTREHDPACKTEHLTVQSPVYRSAIVRARKRA